MRIKTLYILYILIGLTVILNIQCSKNKSEKRILPELMRAERIMFDHPDSALHILEATPMPSERKDRENHALWCLLVTQAKYKQLMNIPSDSLIRIAYDYYKSTDNARRKAMSALYMGNINYNLGNIEEAMQYYLEGKTEVEKTDDYKTGYLIMSSLCQLYLYRNLADYALESCKEAYNYAVKDTNNRYQMTALGLLARCYCISQKLAEAIDVYHECSKKALDLGLGNNEYYYGLQKEMALVYTNSRKFDESLSILKSLPTKYQPLLLIGTNYLMLNQHDSAFYYLTKALNTNNVYTKKAIYESLYKLGGTPRYHQYLKKYCDSLLYYNDSIMKLDKGKEIIAYKEKYDHQKLVNEQQRLKLEKAETQRMLFIIIICLIIVMAIIVYLYQKRLVRKETTIRKQSERLQKYMLQLHEYETRFMQNNHYMEELKAQLSGQIDNTEEINSYHEQIDSLQAENGRLSEKIAALQQHIAEYTSKLDNARKETERFREITEENLSLKQRGQMLSDYVAGSHKLVKDLKKKSRPLEDSEWESLEEMCEGTYGKFVTRLKAVCPTLTKQELYLCILIKLRFSNSQMSEIFGVSTASVSQKKFRLKKHLNESVKDGFTDETTLDRWVAEF